MTDTMLIEKNQTDAKIDTELAVFPVIKCNRLYKSFYNINHSEIPVLTNINLTIEKGDKVAVVGSSGSGKTTLLQLLGGLDSPTRGEVLINGKNPVLTDDNTLSKIRNQQLGFVYQFHHLLPELSALDNAKLPLLIDGKNSKESNEIALSILAEVGLENRALHKPAELSGGERQRVAIARAIINNPLCLLADEPTGNLDNQNATNIIDLLIKLNTKFGMSIILNTHDMDLAQRMSKIYALNNTLEAVNQNL